MRCSQQLRDAGVEVDEKVAEQEFGRFGWAVDPEGNRFELWQPVETLVWEVARSGTSEPCRVTTQPSYFRKPYGTLRATFVTPVCTVKRPHGSASFPPFVSQSS